MSNAKLGKRTDQRTALIRGQVTDLFWYGKLETTEARAKSVKRVAEKLLTVAMDTYQDTVTVKKNVIEDGKKTKEKKEVQNDGVKKLAARRKIAAYVYDKPELRLKKETPQAFKERTGDVNHPILEKIFNVYAPKYDKRRKEVGQGGGYLRIVRKDIRRGDVATTVELQWV
ncbi:MAG: bL17 family ribosomal protein [Firmicutes bacterium]|nr:bL17 family ribosomal protein [Bacillota bacterium]